MDFYDPRKKKSEGIKLFIGYFLITTAIALGALILLFRTYGYDLDSKTGQVIQDGLIYVSSHPVSASVYLNGASEGQTSSRLTVPAGQYTISLARSGYRGWTKTFTLDGGSIEQLDYPLLVPSKLDTSDKQLYSTAPVFATASPDRHWLVVEQPGSLDSFDLYNMNNPKQNPTTFSLPAGLLTASTDPQSLSLVQWSTDSRHILIQHNFGGSTEFIMVDTQTPSDSVNINKIFNSNPTTVSLINNAYDKYYLYNQTAQTLQVADLGSKQVSPLLTQVISYKSYGSNIVLYATAKNAPAAKVDVDIHDGTNNYVLRTLPTGTTYLLNLTQYSGNFYVAVGTQSEGLVYVYENPENALQSGNQTPLIVASVLRIDNPMFVSFSQNARFIAVQSGSSFGVFDIDTDRRFYYTLDKAIDSTQQAQWMDGNRLSVNFANAITVFEFDGTNQQTLAPSLPSFSPYFDQAYDTLYNVAPSVSTPGQFALTKTDMIVK